MAIRCFECEHINPNDSLHCEKCGTALPQQPVNVSQPKKHGIGTGVKVGIGGCVGVLLCMGACVACFTMAGRDVPKNSNAVANVSSAPSVSTIPSAGLPAKESPAVISSKWIAQSDTSPMEDTKDVYLQLTAENSIQGWLATETPKLVIRCKERKADVYIITGMPATVEYGTDSHTVRIRLDDQRAFTEHWLQATDDKALFARNPVVLAKKMAKAKTMLFEFIPFNASPVTVRFDIQGLDQEISKVASACKWK
jgi:hypothetical protein